MTPEPPNLAETIGRNARRIRGDYRTDEVAKVARNNGLRWNPGRVSDLEHGRISPTVPTLFVLAQTLGDVTGERVSIADLVRCDDWVRMNSDLVVSGASVVAAVSGEPVNLMTGDVQGGVEEIQEILRRGVIALTLDDRLPAAAHKLSADQIGRVRSASSLAEERAAKALGLAPLSLAALSLHLWGHTLSEERDSRVGDDANAQYKGRVTRELRAELKKALDGDDP